MKAASLILIFSFFLTCGSGQVVNDRIDSLLQTHYQPQSPGAVVAITQHDKILFEKSYGLADLESRKPIQEHDNFNIGSLTKQFTAFAILDLCNSGRLNLNDSIGKYFHLPHALSSIRIRQLLNHSSGIPDHYGFTDTNTVKHATDKDVLTAIGKASQLYFKSGTHYRYSNTGYCLLGMLIEKISGQPYPDYLQRHIFSPLGLHATVFQYGKPIPSRVIGYEKTENGNFRKADAEESIFFSTEADGGIYISMDDYLTWCEAIVTGKFSRTAMIREAWKGHTLVDTLHSLWYGYGWFVQEPVAPGSLKCVYHTGFNGGFETVVWIIPSLDYKISIFSNRMDMDLEDLVVQINHLLGIPDNSFIKSSSLESFIHSWPIFAPCKETSSFSTLFRKNLNVKGMVLN